MGVLLSITSGFVIQFASSSNSTQLFHLFARAESAHSQSKFRTNGTRKSLEAKNAPQMAIVYKRQNV